MSVRVRALCFTHNSQRIVVSFLHHGIQYVYRYALMTLACLISDCAQLLGYTVKDTVLAYHPHAILSIDVGRCHKLAILCQTNK